MASSASRVRIPRRQTKAAARSQDPFKALAPSSVKPIPIRTGTRRGVRASDRDPWLYPPDSWHGTLPEWAMYWAHQQLKRREGTDFDYRASGGQVMWIEVDFLEYAERVAIQIQGEFWHYEFSNRPRSRDLEQRTRLTGMGWTVVWIDEGDCLSDPVYYLKEALVGRDHSKLGQLGV